MNVKVKQNRNKNNSSTLYLEPYVNGKTGNQKLGLKVFTNPKTRVEKEHNKETLMRAEILRIKLENKLQEQQTGILSRNSDRGTILQFINILVKESKSASKIEILQALSNHISKFSKNSDFKLDEFDEVKLMSFRDYLENATCLNTQSPISRNTQSLYLSKLKFVLGQAKRKKLISINPSEYVQGIKMEEVEKQYLTKSELTLLKAAYCVNDELKRAFLFCCLTGLRHSDVTKLKWSDVQFSTDEEMWKVNFRQKKTGGVQYHPIDESALKFLGNRGLDEHLIFKEIKYTDWMNKVLRKWALSAGIDKYLTFHCSRHTYATLLIANGEEIYTVKELMGHKDIKTTQVYAKVVNHQKNSAASSLGGII